MPTGRLGPLILEPIFAGRIWGAPALPAPYPQPDRGKRVGEIWLTAEDCRVINGEQAERTLGDLACAAQERLGTTVAAGFPLLLKLLLPHDKLSVQVHPNDEQARLLGEPRGKTECWYVVEAEPNAELAVGLRDGATLEDVRSAIADGTMERLLHMQPVRAGDMVFVDAGTIHAIGPGVTVLETQQYSDITYRLFDYGRPRELHVEQGLAVSRVQTSAGLVAPRSMQGFTRMVECVYFAVDRFDLRRGISVALGAPESLQVLFALGAGAVLESDKEDLDIPQGYAVVLPVDNIRYRLRGDVPVMRILQP